jgi:hypothetical protein
MTASILRRHDADDSSRRPVETQVRPPKRLNAVAMAAIVVAGIAAALIAQGVGLSFRFSIVVSALVVGVLISVLHYFQDSRGSSARVRDRGTRIANTKQPKTSRAGHR